MQILIADDEPLARARLRAQLQDLNAGSVVAEAANGVEAIELTRAHRPDVVFMDIRMPAMDGMEAARHLAQLPEPPAVIFTTAYDQHALAAFDARAIDYLVKPIRTERLREALARVDALVGARRNIVEAMPVEGQARTHLSALVKGELRLVPVAEIRFLRADHKYVEVGWSGGEILIEDSLRTLEEEFGDRFLRIHRNALVAGNHIIAIERDDADNFVVVLDGTGRKLPISRRLLGQVRRRVRNI
ncbi:MAG: response regulator transcription factor [Gammaproteobacteria bacterium]|nr:response regulator transcription factor [Gammaproteobacteria bacterium]